MIYSGDSGQSFSFGGRGPSQHLHKGRRGMTPKPDYIIMNRRENVIQNVKDIGEG